MNDDHVTIPVNNSSASSVGPIDIGAMEIGTSSQVTHSHINISDHISVPFSREKEEEKAPLLNETSTGQDTVHTAVETSERNQNFRGFARYFKMVIPDVVRRKEAENTENKFHLSDMAVGHGSHVRDMKIDVKDDDKEEKVHVNREVSSSCSSMEAEEGCDEGKHTVEHGDNGLIGFSKQCEVGIKPTIGECRICQEEDDIANLESPCACSGSLQVVSNCST